MNIILKNESELADSVAYSACMELIEANDGEDYRPISRFKVNEVVYIIWITKNKDSFTFKVVKF